VLLPMRPSIPVSTAEILKNSHVVHELVTFVSRRVHKDDMQTRSHSSIAPQFQQGDKVSEIAKSLFLRGQLDRKLMDQRLGPFKLLENVGANSLRLKLPSTIRLHLVFHVNNFRPCPTPTPRRYDPVTTLKENDEYDVDHI
jgi:hypothetical protein